MHKQKIKVLLIAPSPNLAGGISRWTKHILHYYKINNSDCNLDYLCSAQYKYSLKKSLFERLYSGVFNYIKVILKFIKRVSYSNYDVAHITTSASISLIKDLWLIKIAKHHNIKSIVHFRFGRIPELFEKNNWEWKLLKKVVSSADMAITIDLKSYASLVSAGFRNVVNLPNPLSNEILEKVEQNNDLIIQPRTIIFVGQMLRTKGIYELVEVCSQIPNIRLNMYGSLPKGVEHNLKDLAGEDSDKWLNIAGEIDYDLIINKMKGASIFVLPTYTEGFPNVILESMACGCPIVASKVGAIPEMLAAETSAPCGILIEPKNKLQLKEAIEYLLANPDKAKILGNRAKERVRKEYSIDSVWRKMVNIWTESLIK